MTGRKLVIAMAFIVTAVAFAGVGDVAASGDQVQQTHGEDEGYYDLNNNNPFEDDTFPGQSSQNRTGM